VASGILFVVLAFLDFRAGPPPSSGPEILLWRDSQARVLDFVSEFLFFVLVGHSFGGALVRLYAHEYPNEVAGMVLVDAAHEDLFVRIPAWRKAVAAGVRQFRALTPLSAWRLMALSTERIWNRGFPRRCNRPIPCCRRDHGFLRRSRRGKCRLRRQSLRAARRPRRALQQRPAHRHQPRPVGAARGRTVGGRESAGVGHVAIPAGPNSWVCLHRARTSSPTRVTMSSRSNSPIWWLRQSGRWCSTRTGEPSGIEHLARVERLS
jgi:pimeloyl-ACP methyl ester carboxylesterase